MSKVLAFILILSASSLASAQPNAACSSFKFPDTKSFHSCSDLPVLDSAIHWNYHPSSNTVDVAFRHHRAGGDRRWAAWAINPTSKGMVGSQALIALPQTDGSIRVYTSQIMSYRTGLLPGNLSFPVRDLSATIYNGELVIFATIQLPNNLTTVNHVWEEGPMSAANRPMMHDVGPSSPNTKSMGTLDFLSGRIMATGDTSKNTLKYTHGVLNAVSWGIMMPIGVMIARFVHAFKSESPLWFNLHVGCQIAASLLGLAGFGTGVTILSLSGGLLRYKAHLGIGIVLVCLLLEQVLGAGFFRPHVGEKWRPHFEWGHRIVGWLILGLAIANNILGFFILKASGVWLIAYICVVTFMACLSGVLEVLKWCKSSQSKSAIEYV